MTQREKLSHVTFQTMDEHAASLILNEDHPFIKWLIDFSNSLKDWNNKTLALERGIEVLFTHHLDNTLFSRHGFNDDKLKGLKSYLEKLESMPEFPAIEKAPIDSIKAHWKTRNS